MELSSRAGTLICSSGRVPLRLLIIPACFTQMTGDSIYLPVAGFVGINLLSNVLHRTIPALRLEPGRRPANASDTA